MKTRNLIPVLLLASAGLAFAREAAPLRVQADSRINVRFVEPEKFTDVKDTWSGSADSYQENVLAELRKDLEQRGESLLREDLHLSIRVTDVDLAGDFEPGRFRNGEDVRIVKDIYPVRIKLQFQLSDSTGAMLAGGERTLSDFGRITDPFPKSDRLRHEKEVLRSWLATEFKSHRKA